MNLLNVTELKRFEMVEVVNFVLSFYKITQCRPPTLDFPPPVFPPLPPGPSHMLVLLTGMLGSSLT